MATLDKIGTLAELFPQRRPRMDAYALWASPRLIGTSGFFLKGNYYDVRSRLCFCSRCVYGYGSDDSHGSHGREVADCLIRGLRIVHVDDPLPRLRQLGRGGRRVGCHSLDRSASEMATLTSLLGRGSMQSAGLVRFGRRYSNRPKNRQVNRDGSVNPIPASYPHAILGTSHSCVRVVRFQPREHSRHIRRGNLRTAIVG